MRRSIQLLSKITTLLFLTVLMGCAAGSSIVTGEKRAAVSPNEVRIYIDPPAKFETIGIVEAVSEIGFSRQKAQNKAIKQLKKRAAKLGATGILLTDTRGQASGTAGVYANGVFVTGVGEQMTVQGRAIYVTQE